MSLQQTISQYAVLAAPYIGIIILSAVTWLTVHAKNWLSAHTKNALVTGILERLATEVYVVIENFEQTAITMLKAKNGGVLTFEDAQAIKSKEIALIKSNLGGDQWVAEVQKILGVQDIQAFLAARVESAVLSLNKGNPTPAAAPVVVAAPVAPAAVPAAV